MKKDKQTDSLCFWNTASRFLNHYLPDIRRSSPNTVESYRCSLNHYIDYLEIERKVNRKEVSFIHFGRGYIKEYMSWMNKTKELAPKTCNLRLTAIHSLMEYASSECTDLMALYLESCSIKGMKTPQKPIEFFEKNAMSAIMNAPDITKKTERRNQMLLIFLYDTAARVSEMIYDPQDPCNGSLSERDPPNTHSTVTWTRESLHYIWLLCICYLSYSC
jgi:integrase/recombinase XerD